MTNHIGGDDNGYEERNPRPRWEDYPHTFRGLLAFVGDTAGWGISKSMSVESTYAEVSRNTKLLEEYDRGFYAALSDLMDLSQDPSADVESFKAHLNEALTAQGPAASLFRGLLLAATAMQGMVGVYAPLATVMAYKGAKIFKPARPSPADLWPMQRRGIITPEQVMAWARDTGLHDEMIAGYKALTQVWLPPADLDVLYLRGVIGRDEWVSKQEALGVGLPEILQREEMLKVIPGIGDLIAMGVREAWRDDVAAKYGYDEDYPGELTEWAAKQGLSADWCKRYWRAHWVLPGPSIAREMLWRTSMTEGDYGTLLHIADYPKTFRDWMTEVAFTPWTRVDIRRMYDLGIIEDRAGLEWAYEQIGYTGKQLDGIVDFTIALYGEEERDATKGDILLAYELGRLTEAEARSYLEMLGYRDWMADIYITRIDLKRSNALAKETIKHIKTLYINGQISRGEATVELANIPLPGAEITKLFEEWDIAKRAKVGRPSKSELRRFFIQNILDEGTLRKELAGHRLSEVYIDIYVDDAKLDLKEAMEKEAERARKEAERIRKAKIKTKADIRLADYVVAVATANVAIADIKLSMVKEMPLAELERARELILEYKVLIAQLYAAMAEVRKVYIEQVAQEV